jgi:hypothetical protein
MAAILDAMAPYVTKLIADMAREEVDMLLGVSRDIEKLKDNMESIKCFLADAERRRITEQIVQRWVRKLKDAMYDALTSLTYVNLKLTSTRNLNVVAWRRRLRDACSHCSSACGIPCSHTR